MKTALVQIGNSRGIRIPKAFLEQCQFTETVELELRRDHLVIRPAAESRSGWDDAFCRMSTRGDDALIDEGQMATTHWDATEWEW